MTNYAILKGFFESATLPRAVLLNEYTFISDVEKFVRSHLAICENKTDSSPYEERLACLMQIIVKKEKSAILIGKATITPPFRMLNKIDAYGKYFQKISSGGSSGDQEPANPVSGEREENSKTPAPDKTKRKANGVSVEDRGMGGLFA